MVGDLFICEKGTYFPICKCCVGIAIKEIGSFNFIAEYHCECIIHKNPIVLYVPVKHSTRWLDQSFSDNIKKLLE